MKIFIYFGVILTLAGILITCYQYLTAILFRSATLNSSAVHLQFIAGILIGGGGLLIFYLLSRPAEAPLELQLAAGLLMAVGIFLSTMGADKAHSPLTDPRSGDGESGDETGRDLLPKS